MSLLAHYFFKYFSENPDDCINIYAKTKSKSKEKYNKKQKNIWLIEKKAVILRLILNFKPII